MGNIQTKILTFNTGCLVKHGFFNNQAKLLGEIINGNYDIVALQECPIVFKNLLSKNVNHNLLYYNSNLIMSKYNLQLVTKHKHYVICQSSYDNIPFRLCCLHLPSTKGKILNRIQILKELLDDPYNSHMIFLGDFNMTTDEYTQLSMAHPELYISPQLNTYGNQHPYDRIILKGKNIKFTSYPRALDIGIGSDHLAVATNISIENNDTCRLI